MLKLRRPNFTVRHTMYLHAETEVLGGSDPTLTTKGPRSKDVNKSNYMTRKETNLAKNHF